MKKLPKKSNLIKSKLDNIITKFHKNNLLGANKFSQVVVNPFRHDFSLIEIIIYKMMKFSKKRWMMIMLWSSAQLIIEKLEKICLRGK